MGEAYKGLTIRFGGDLSDLKRSLKTVEGTVKATESSLKEFNKALKFDPRNTVVLGMKFDALKLQARELKAQIHQTRDTLLSLGKGDNIQDIIRNTREARVEAARWGGQYREVDHQIAKVKDRMIEIAKDKGGITLFDKQRRKAADFEKKIQEINDKELTELKEKLEALAKLHNEAFDKKQASQEAAEIQTLIEKLGTLEAQYESVNSQLAKGFMAGDFNKADSALEELKLDLNKTDSALELIRNEAKLFVEAFEQMPAKAGLLKAKLESNADAMARTEKKAQQLREAIAVMEKTGLKVSKLSAAELAEKLQEAEQNVRRGEAELADMSGKIREIRYELDRLEAMNQQDTDDYREKHAELVRLEGDLKNLENRVKTYESKARSAFNAKQLKEMHDELLRTEMALNKMQKEAGEFAQSLVKTEPSLEAIRSEAAVIDAAFERLPQSFDLARQKIKNAESEVEALSDRAKMLRNELDGMKARGIDGAATSARKLATEFVRLKEEEAQASNQVAELTAKFNKAYTAAAKLKEAGKDGSSYYKKREKEVDELRAALDKAKAKADEAKTALKQALDEQKARGLYLELQKVEGELHAAKAAANGFGTSLGAAITANSQKLVNLGYALASNVTSNLWMAGRYAVQAADEVDSAYRNMRKTVNGTEEDFAKLKNTAQEFSQTHFTSAADVLQIQALGGQLGIAADELGEFATVVSNLDIATDIDAEDAAVDLGQMANILSDLSVKTMPNFADSLVRLGNNNAALESNIMKVASRIGSTSSIIGMSTDQILAWSTAIASTGQGPEAAGTAISKTMNQIEAAVSGTTDKSREKLALFADTAGMTAEQFSAAWKSGPSEAMQAFVEGLARIEEGAGSAETRLTELSINSVRQKQSLKSLSQMTDVLSDSLIMSNNAWNGVTDQWGEAGDAANEAAKKAEGFSGQLQIMKNNAMVFGTSLMESFAPAMGLINAVLKPMVDAFESLPGPMKMGGAALLAFAAAAGPVIIFAARIAEALKMLKESSIAQQITFMKMNAGIKEGESVFKQLVTLVRAAATEQKASAAATNASAAAHKASTAAVAGESVAVKALVGNERAAEIITKKLGTENVVYAAKTGAATLATKLFSGALKGLLVTAGITAAVYAISAAFEAVTGAVAEANKEFDSFIDLTSTNLENTSNVLSEVSSNLSETSVDAANIESLGSEIAQLNEQLNSAKTNSLDYASAKAQLSQKTRELNELTGETTVAIDQETGKLRNQKTDIEALTAAIARKKRIEEAGDNIKSLDKQLSLLKQQEAEISRMAAEQGGDMSAIGASKLNGQLQETRKQIEELTAARNKYQEEYGKELALNNVASVLVDNVIEKRLSEETAVNMVAQALDGLATREEAESMMKEKLAEEYARMEQELQQMTEELTSFADENAAFESSITSAGLSVEELASYLQESGMSVEDFKTKFSEATDTIVNNFQLITATAKDNETGDAMTFDKAIKNLDKNADAYGKWQKNLKLAYDAVGEDGKAFVQEIEAGGMQYSAVLQEMLDAGDKGVERAKEISKKIAKAGITATGVDTGEAKEKAAKQGEEQAKAVGEGQAKGFQAGAVKASKAAADANNKVNSAVKAGKQAVYNSAYDNGQQIGKGMSQGITDSVNLVTGAINSATGSATKQVQVNWSIHSPSRVAMRLARYYGEGLAIGIESKKQAVAEAAKKTANAAIYSTQNAFSSGRDYTAYADMAKNVVATNREYSNQSTISKSDLRSAVNSVVSSNAPANGGIVVNLSYDASSDAASIAQDIAFELQRAVGRGV